MKTPLEWQDEYCACAPKFKGSGRVDPQCCACVIAEDLVEDIRAEFAALASAKLRSEVSGLPDGDSDYRLGVSSGFRSAANIVEALARPEEKP